MADSKMDDTGGVRARYAMAGGSSSDTFGCEPLSRTQGKSMGPVNADMMKDCDRGAGMPVKHTKGKMPAQANPDHGPHNFSGRSGDKL